MRTFVLLFVTTVLFTPAALGREVTPAGATRAPAKSVNRSPKKRLRAFRSEGELKRYLRKLAGGVAARRGVVMPSPMTAQDSDGSAAVSTQSAGAPAKTAAAEESVTNVQHAGVDEGGIVKLHGDHLVVLRRG